MGNYDSSFHARDVPIAMAVKREKIKAETVSFLGDKYTKFKESFETLV
jgi:hypothetical protein